MTDNLAALAERVEDWIGDNLARKTEWVEICEREVRWYEGDEHREQLAPIAERWRKSLARAQHALKIARALDNLRRDRDEWREQHENLLSVRQQDLASLAKAQGEPQP